ncbi:MAG: prealbumin-like fold domain-containing protein [Eubacteriales bacterium]
MTFTYAGQEETLLFSTLSLTNERQKAIVSLKKEMEQHSVYPNPEAYKDIQFGLYVAEDISDVNGTVALGKDSLLEVITLDETLTGTVITDLPIGRYYLQEISTNEAYNLDDTKYPIEFTYQGQKTATVEIAANNGQPVINSLKKGQMEIAIKLPDESGKPLPNAIYGIYST